MPGQLLPVQSFNDDQPSNWQLSPSWQVSAHYCIVPSGKVRHFQEKYPSGTSATPGKALPREKKPSPAKAHL
jgi:hypothetical protein